MEIDVVNLNNFEILNNKCCYRCGKDKSIEDFPKDKKRKDGRKTICKECANLSKREYRSKNKDKMRIYAKTYHNKHPHRGVGEYSKYKEKRLMYGANRRLRIKVEVLTHYGNGECACVKCGFTNPIALTIDHINGNGTSHRNKNRNVSGNRVYEWLKRNQFPDGYQTLCMNCQFIKRVENHECSNSKENKIIGDEV